MQEHLIQTVRRRMLPALMLACAMLVFTGCDDDKHAAAAPGPVPETEVVAIKAISMTVPRERYEIGTASAPEEVEIKSRVQGWIDKRPMKEGMDVKKGDLLFQIDEAPFKVRVDISKSMLDGAQVALKFAKEGLLVEQAKQQAARDKAAWDQGVVEVKRYTELVKNAAETQQKLDLVTAREKELAANYANSQAGVGQAELQQRSQIDKALTDVEARKSELEQRNLDLSYCKITAPFDARVGEAKFSEGALVAIGGDPLAVLRMVDPLEVKIKIDGRLLPKVQQSAKEVGKIEIEITNDKYSHPHRGKVTFIDNAVDPETSTFLVKATVDNPEKVLLPGLYVKVRMILGMREDAVIVPEKCVLQSPRGSVVYVIDAENMLKSVPVELGDAFDDMRVLASGVKSGDTLVYEGVQFVKPGIKVKPTVQTFELPDSLKPAKTEEAPAKAKSPAAPK